MSSKTRPAPAPQSAGLALETAAVAAPTLAVAALIYGGWLALTFFHAKIPLLVAVLAGGWLAAWHGSLQHEVIHGHPTPWRRFNTALAIWPLALWLPFELYRSSHLEHHATDDLTFPGLDPESRYLGERQGLTFRLRRAIEAAQAPLLGRLLLGPFISVGGFLISEAAALARGDVGHWRAWSTHLALTAVVLAWVMGVCKMSLGEYLLIFVYPGAALTLLRSFAEHRADARIERRIAVVERAPILSLLFLNNNLHALHHARPDLPWSRLPAVYKANRAQILQANGSLVYDGYGEVFARFLLRPHDRITHPGFGAGT
ncbi:MAG: fatty acid desaturase [Caulobacteraceae bacterium]